MDIRRAADGDWKAISRLLDDLDLDHATFSCENFWVAEGDGEIMGVVHLEDCGSCAYLSAVGVDRRFQGMGVASDLIARVSDENKKDVYVYTLIPDFFRRLGFELSAPYPGLPSKHIYDCESTCDPQKCKCMVLRTDAAKISTI